MLRPEFVEFLAGVTRLVRIGHEQHRLPAELVLQAIYELGGNGNTSDPENTWDSGRCAFRACPKTFQDDMFAFLNNCPQRGE